MRVTATSTAAQPEPAHPRHWRRPSARQALRRRCYLPRIRRPTELGGRERLAENRLVNVAEGDVFLRKIAQSLFAVPAGVAHLDHAWKLDKLPQQPFQVFAVLIRVPEGNGKLRSE